MTLTDVITAVLIMGLFLSGFSQAFLSGYKAWNMARAEYNTAKTIQFIAESFKNECAKPDGNIENWKKIAASAKELESFQIKELKEGGILRALMAICLISGEYIEVIGLLNQ